MVDKPKELKQGDPCPVDGGELVAVAGAAEKDGLALYRCRTCGYNARFKATEPAAAASKAK